MKYLIFKISLFLSVFFVLVIGVSKVQAQTKQYWYDSISVSIKINQDSTFDVEERQVFHYVDQFNKGWRSIPLNKVSDISDISVVDGKMGKALIYSRKSLDKLNPPSWGKFNYFKENNALNIEWYYDLADTTYEWVLKYKVHGGIEFNPESDRLYWNIFTDYDVPVNEAKVTVLLPKAVGQNNLKATAYRNQGAPLSTLSWGTGSDSVIYSVTKFPAYEDFTIDVSWPKGIVSQSAFWRDFIKLYYGYILSPIIIFLAFLSGFFYWLFGEKLKKGRGIIIPQYEPPQNLRPAMAEVICKEKVTQKGLSATVIDLAVRGCVKIETDSPNFGDIFKRFLYAVVVAVAFGTAALVGTFGASEGFKISSLYPQNLGFFLFTILLFQLALVILAMFGGLKRLLKFSIKEFFFPPNYIIRKAKEFEKDTALEDYEKEFLRILFGWRYAFLSKEELQRDFFSTKELKKNQTKARELYGKIEELKASLYKETEQDTKAYEIGVSSEYTKWISWSASGIGLFLLLLFIGSWLDQPYTILLTLAVSILGLYIFIKYEARLSREGRILKEDWLGFKMYLETAERYRMQNLTPEAFEKYLPYAMIFGVEKKWAKAFESLHMSSPSWYSGGGYGDSGHSTSPGMGSFSPSGFSASFSSSFTSAFSSSGAGGSGGGGGGAGGGGGGGGGGAS